MITREFGNQRFTGGDVKALIKKVGKAYRTSYLRQGEQAETSTSGCMKERNLLQFVTFREARSYESFKASGMGFEEKIKKS